MLGAAPTSRRHRGALFSLASVVGVTTMLFVTANALATAKTATTRSTPFWGVALDGRQADEPNQDLLTEARVAGVRAIVTDPRRWSRARHRRLVAIVRKLDMIVIEPQRPPKTATGWKRLDRRCRADTGTLRRCALVAVSVREAVAIAQHETVPFVVVRLDSPADLHLLKPDSFKRTRLIAVLTVGDSPTLDEGWQQTIAVAARNSKATLAVGLSGPVAVAAIHAYLSEIMKYKATASAQASKRGGEGSDVLPPSPPLAIATTNVTQTSLTLSWPASTDDKRVVGYDIYVNGGPVGSTRETTYAVVGLACGTVYTFSVDAYDRANNRSLKASMTASTSSCSPPPPPPPTSPPPSPIPTEWTLCAQEGARCRFTGTAEVRYGAGTAFTTPKQFADGVDCTNAVFGDPIFGTAKHCDYRAVPPPAPSDTQPPTTPGNVRATTATGTSITIVWNASSDYVGVAGYRVYNGGSVVGSTSMTSYAVSGLSCGTGYTLAVEAYDAAGNRSQRATISTATSACPPPPPSSDTQPPTSPGNVRASAATATAITIAWNASSDNVGVAGYRVYSGGSVVGSTSTTSYTVSGFSCGTGYTLAVEAYDAAGNRSQRAAITAATSACPPPPPGDTQAPTTPGNLHASAATATAITIAWNASSDNVGVAGYRVYSGGSVVGSTSTTSYTVSGFSCGTGYTLAAEAYDAAGNRSQRASIGASTAACPPSLPSAGTVIDSFDDTWTPWGKNLINRWRVPLGSDPWSAPGDIGTPWPSGGGMWQVSTPYGPGFKMIATDEMKVMSGGKKAEQADVGHLAGTAQAVEVWSGKVMFPAAGNANGFPRGLPAWNVFLQFHGQGAGLTTMGIDTGTTSSSNNIYIQTYENGIRRKAEDPNRLVYDKWYSWKIEVKWSSGSDGYIKWWLDGVLMRWNLENGNGTTTQTGPTTEANDRPWLQFGFYSMAQFTNTVFHAQVCKGC
jgi:chitodextrinase